MILKKDMLTKSLKKGRTTAQSLLQQLSLASGLPAPHYEYEAGGYTNKPSHFFKVRFRVPSILLSEQEHDDSYHLPSLSSNVIVGSGRCRSKKFAKSLAALEAVHRLEEALDIKRGGVQEKLDDYLKQQEEKKRVIEETPLEEEIPGVSWDHVPVDQNFPETFRPATRRGRLDFFRLLRENDDAFVAAKAITLLSTAVLPKVDIHANQTDLGIVQQWANIRSSPFGGSGKYLNISGPVDKELNMGVSKQQAELLALEILRHRLSRQSRAEGMVDLMDSIGNRSFGMAKLFVELPQHQHEGIKDLIQQIQDNPIMLKNHHKGAKRRREETRNQDENQQATQDVLKSRIDTFRAHQKEYPLPIDAVEKVIPHDALITIVRGGTGSGKTTRYPLMLSLLSKDENTKVIVAQPRRLACQAAARRVAYEQGFQLGKRKKDCPIGYQIRFESFAPNGNRTVDFATPGVLLRKASMDDSLFASVTHLVIDEVHERNADMDLLLALAKQAVARRANHETLPPLRLVLMSATLDSSAWENYFDEHDVAIVDAPETRRFPIDVVHLGDNEFPKGIKSIKSLTIRNSADYDETLCKVTAELAVKLFKTQGLNENDCGSILCFLPGMDEIRLVDRFIRAYSRDKKTFAVRFLHSSLSSNEQAKVFQPGPKIILSTNLAETSVTIPDVKVVIDTGRERQHSLLESSSSSDTTTVVGSQLATVSISKAAAKQRAGRAGRVSAGTCYRLYTREQHDEFSLFRLPEMLRMELSQIVLHSLSAYNPSSGHSLHLLLDAPDPPLSNRLRQTLRSLASQGLVTYDPSDEENVSLTPLGHVVSSIPASPRLGRLLFVGLALRAIEPALRMAALLSVPKVFSIDLSTSNKSHCSDMVRLLEEFNEFLNLDIARKDVRRHPKGKLFEQVRRVERQLEANIKSFLSRHAKKHVTTTKDDSEWSAWNANSNRVGALAGLVCVATPHIAHLVSGKSDFATRDVAGFANVHPSSCNFDNGRRVHWYVYHELRATRRPYLHVTTAVSPLELALFAEASGLQVDGDDEEIEDCFLYDKYLQQHANWLFVADQWVPVDMTKPSQRDTMLRTRKLLMGDMLQQIAQDPAAVLASADNERLVLFVLSALEQQRLSK